MTRSAHDEAVEAAASVLVYEDSMALPTGHHFATLAITAYLRHMRAAGFVVTQEMEEKPPASAANNEFWRGFYAGWNEYRSRTLANAVEVPE